jgi:cell division protein FtsB
MRKAVRILLFALCAVALVVLFVLPGRELLDQSHQLASTRQRLTMLRTEDRVLSNKAASLQTDATIEQIAREDYGLVMPGEQAYVVLPPVAHGSTATTP